MSHLLDTNVISEIRRGRDPGVRGWADQLVDSELYLSTLTLGEIRKGIDLLRRRDASQADALADWLAQLRRRFAQRILGIDATIAEEWGRINAIRTRNTVDSLIAATARVHGLTIATRNVADFEGCGVPLVNPWHFR